MTVLYIYEYDRETFEYLGKEQKAEANPEETKIKGQFIPLVPAYATLIKPPIVEDGHVAVFINNEWIEKEDYRNYYTVDENLTITKIKTIDKPEGTIIVDKELADKIKSNSDDYKIENNQVVEKTVEEKEKEHKEKIALLSLTKREVFLALYKAKGITPDMVKEKIPDTEALIEFEYANEYYRGNPLIDLIGAKLGYTSDDLDYLFENKELPKKLT